MVYEKKKTASDTKSLFKILSSGVPQGSILGPILFNIFINDFLFFINEAKLANFADDNTIYAAKRDLNELLRLLEKESEVVIKWFSDNNIIVNPIKFQVIIINKQNRSNHNCCSGCNKSYFIQVRYRTQSFKITHVKF